MEIAHLGYEIDTKGLEKGVTSLGRLDDAGVRAEKSASKTGKAFKSLTGIFAALGVSKLITDTFRASASMEAMTASLKTVTGSALAADSALAEIKKFAKTTPYDLEQSVQGFIKLKALGLDPSMEALRSYGNTASAMGKSLNQAVEAVADAATGEFERLKEFGIKAKSQGDLVSFTFQGVTNTVGKNAAEIEGYLRGIGDVNFAGAMTEQAGTLNGVLSNLRDSFTNLQVKFFATSGIADKMKEVMLNVTTAFNNFTESLGGGKQSSLLNDLANAGSVLFKTLEFGVSVISMASVGLYGLREAFAPLRDSLFAQTADFAINGAMSEMVQKSSTLSGIFDVLQATFTDTELVGISLVEGLLVGFERIKQGAKIAGAGLKVAFTAPINFIMDSFGEMVRAFGKFSAIFGKNDISRAIESFGSGIKGVLNPMETYNNRMSEIEKETNSAISQIKIMTGEQADYAIATKLAASQSKAATDAVSNLTPAVKAAGSEVGLTADQIKRMAEEAKKAKLEADRLADATGTNLLKSQKELNEILDEANLYTSNYSKALESAKQAITSRGLIEGTKAYDKALEDLGFRTDDLSDKTKDTTATVSELWKNSVGSVQGTLADLFKNGKDGFDNWYDALLDKLKDFLITFAAQWAASGILGMMNNEGFSGFSVNNAFSDGNGGNTLGGIFGGGSSTTNADGTVSSSPVGDTISDSLGISQAQYKNLIGGAMAAYGIYNGVNSIKNGNEVGGAIQTASGAIGGYNAYQGFTGGTELSGAGLDGLSFAGDVYGFYSGLKQGGIGGYTQAATSAYSGYGNAMSLYNWYTGSQAALGAAGTATYSAPLVATSLSGAGAGAAAGSTAGGTGSTAAGSGGLGSVALWGAVAFAFDKYANDGRVMKGYGTETDIRYEGLKSLFDGDFSSFNKSMFDGPLQSLETTFGGRPFEQIIVEDYLPELLGERNATGANGEIGFNGGNTGIFGNNYGNNNSGLSSVQMSDGGVDGNVGFFTGAQSAIEEFAKMAEAAGFATQSTAGFLEINSGAESTDEILNLWSVFNDGLETAYTASDRFKTSYESGLLDSSNLLFQNLNLATGLNADASRDAILLMDQSFDTMVANGVDASEALVQSFSTGFGLSLEESTLFFDESIADSNNWVEKLSGNSGEALNSMLDFGETGQTIFEQLGQSGADASSQISGEINNMANEALDSFKLIDAGFNNATSYASQAQQTYGNLENAVYASNARQVESNQAAAESVVQSNAQLVNEMRANTEQTKNLMQQIRNTPTVNR